ncbi:MAG: glycine/sarcosine/betaine reductase complex component C subunit beta [Thermodesulfobacteriota bacterium]|jgi:betaine reductase
MRDFSRKENVKPVVKGVSYFLAHVPSMVRHGSKPSREIMKDPSILAPILAHLEDFNHAVAYPPNQVFIGNLDPEELRQIPSPWYQHPVPKASREGSFGEIMPEEEFYGMLKICDEFGLIMLEESFLREVALTLSGHPLFHSDDQKKLDKGNSLEQIRETINGRHALPLYIQRDRLIGCIQAGHEEDTALAPEILLENLASRASGALALRHLITKTGRAEEIDYLLGCGEEAVGDRYNRGGGSLSKAIGELCGCVRATGSDVKAFCCAPVHAMVLAAGLIASKTFNNVVLVGGGSLPKLGMKFHGHLRHDMPILEDVLAGIAIWVSPDDGKSPVLRLDSVGKHEIGSGSAQQAILNKLVVEPLDRLGLKLTQIDKYATEMHNPEITEPQGSGNVPRTNYRTIGSFAVIRKEIEREELEQFVEVHGMPGFSPTQGHIASAVPFLGHALKKIMAGEMKYVLFLAKGSLFLGRMTQLSDGLSFLLEKNEREG